MSDIEDENEGRKPQVSVVVGHTADGRHVAICVGGKEPIVYLPLVEAARMAADVSSLCRKLSRRAAAQQSGED